MRCLLIVLSVLFCVTRMCYAQITQMIDVSDKADAVIVETSIDIENIGSELNNIETLIRQKTIAVRGSQTNIKQLSSFQDVLTKEKQRATTQLENTAKKIASLNALVAEGETEPVWNNRAIPI